jgi:hypothetical protein
MSHANTSGWPVYTSRPRSYSVEHVSGLSVLKDRRLAYILRGPAPRTTLLDNEPEETTKKQLVLVMLPMAGGFACTPLRMGVPADLAQESEAIQVTDRSRMSGALANESFKMGPLRNLERRSQMELVERQFNRQLHCDRGQDRLLLHIQDRTGGGQGPVWLQGQPAQHQGDGLRHHHRPR